MTDVLNSFWLGFEDEIEKIAATKWKAMYRAGQLSPASQARIGIKARTPLTPSSVGAVGRGLDATQKPLMMGPRERQLRMAELKGKRSATPAPPPVPSPAAAPAPATQTPMPAPRPQTINVHLTQPTSAAERPSFGRSFAEGATSMLPYMIMNRQQQQQQRRSVYV